MDTLYGEVRVRYLQGQLNLLTDTFKVMLVTVDYVFDWTQIYVTENSNSPRSFEVQGTGYAAGYGNAGRQPLVNTLLTKNTSLQSVQWIANTLAWNNINVGLVGGAIIIKEIPPSDATSLLVGYFNTGYPQVTDGSEMQHRWGLLGIALF